MPADMVFWGTALFGMLGHGFQSTTPRVVRLRDQSGNGNDWTQSTELKAPPFSQTAGVDGLPSFQTGLDGPNARTLSGPVGTILTSSLSYYLRTEVTAVPGARTMLSCDDLTSDLYDIELPAPGFVTPTIGASTLNPGIAYTVNVPFAVGFVGDPVDMKSYPGNTGAVAAATAGQTNKTFSVGLVGDFFSGGFATEALWQDVLFWKTPLVATERDRVSIVIGNPTTRVPGPQIIFDGNSLVYGARTTDFLRYAFPALTILALPLYWSGMNMGKSGITTTQMIARFPTVIAPLSDLRRVRNYLVGWEIHNELYAGVAPAVALANWAAYVALARAAGFKIVSITVTPVSTGAPSFAPVTYEPSRQIVNAALRANPGLIYGDLICDVGNSSTPIGFPGAELTVYYYPDGEHLNDLGHMIVEGMLLPLIT